MRSKIRLALCSFVVLGLLLWAAPALAVPPIPHAFYGTVTINGTDAPIGTVVSAKINGEDAGSYTTTAVGQYGSLAERDYLAVGNANANDGDTITFYVRGIITDTATFSSGGGPTEKNLALVITDDSTTGEVEETIPPGQTDVVVDASDIADTTITVDTLAGLGEVTVTVKRYYSNPYPEVTPPANMVPKYCDIEVDNPDAVAWPMYVEQTYTEAEVAGLVESSLGMYYYKAGAWHRCSDTGVNTAANYVWANMTSDELSGSPVAIGGAAAPSPPSGGDGGDGGVPPAITTLSLTGLTATPALKVNSSGIVQSTCHLKTADSKLALDIAKSVKLLNSQGNPLVSLSVVTELSPPEPPSGETLVMAYDLGPDGAAFSPAITLTLEYNPATLAEDVDEEDLYIAYWDGSKWLALETTVNTEANTVSCQLSHFTTFAIIGAVTPLPPPPPAPAAFSVSTLSILPTEVQPNEAVTITVSVANTGGMEGSYTVVLKIDGVKEAEKSITVAAGSSEIVTFSVTREEAGSYSVEVDGLSGSFTVTAPPAPPEELVPPEEVVPPAPTPINWPILGGIIAGVVVVGLLIFFLVRRRAY